MKLTKKIVDDAQLPVGKDQICYRDEQLKGFALRVTASGTISVWNTYKYFVVRTV